MITYVNTVFVSNAAAANVVADPMAGNVTKGHFVVQDVDSGAYINTAADAGNAKRIKVGIITGKTSKDHKGIAHNEVRWSNIINKDDVRSFSVLTAPQNVDTEDTVTIDFSNLDQQVLNLLDEGGKRVIVRLTFKDLPTRFRKWTESYEYVTVAGETKATLVTAIANKINKEWKRARVNAVADATEGAEKIVLTAFPYSDDNNVDTLNWAEKERFNVNIYYTDPAAEGWESHNKHFPTGVIITKVPGFRYAADAKLVRDREAQAMGYLGILNRGEGTWPIIKPDMETVLSNKYNAITLMFENMYRAADDIFRKNKQSIEIYAVGSLTAANSIGGLLQTFASGAPIKDTETEDGQ